MADATLIVGDWFDDEFVDFPAAGVTTAKDGSAAAGTRLEAVRTVDVPATATLTVPMFQGAY